MYKVWWIFMIWYTHRTIKYIIKYHLPYNVTLMPYRIIDYVRPTIINGKY